MFICPVATYTLLINTYVFLVHEHKQTTIIVTAIVTSKITIDSGSTQILVIPLSSPLVPGDIWTFSMQIFSNLLLLSLLISPLPSPPQSPLFFDNNFVVKTLPSNSNEFNVTLPWRNDMFNVFCNSRLEDGDKYGPRIRRIINA